MKKLILRTLFIALLLVVVLIVPVSADDDSESSPELAILLSGPLYFAYIQAKYGGFHLRHQFEQDTHCELTDITGEDKFIELVKGSPKSSISNFEYTSDNPTAKTWRKLVNK